ncbi:hypothetical protein BDW74DRAFT_162677 [Aspergillus multicolor]|uniref:LOG family protein n=1 Tax=Aspergillus multicolor TaxID=41759 RepID=UPI003CCE1AA8
MEGGPGSGFVALAGGFGTIQELMEMMTWNQLGIHQVGVVLLNVNGYWDGIVLWIRSAVGQGFISAKNAKIIAEASDPAKVVGLLMQYQASEDRLRLNWVSSRWALTYPGFSCFFTSAQSGCCTG